MMDGQMRSVNPNSCDRNAAFLKRISPLDIVFIYVISFFFGARRRSFWVPMQSHHRKIWIIIGSPRCSDRHDDVIESNKSTHMGGYLLWWLRGRQMMRKRSSTKAQVDLSNRVEGAHQMRGIRHSLGSWWWKMMLRFWRKPLAVMKTPVEFVIRTGKAAGSMHND